MNDRQRSQVLDDAQLPACRLCARFVPRSLSPLIAWLEVAEHEVVTRGVIEGALAELGSDADTDAVLRRLQRLRWLLPLRTRGAWEFAPAGRGAALPKACPYTEVRATALLRPDLEVALAYESAARLHGLAGAQGHFPALVAAAGTKRPAALSRFRWVGFDVPDGAREQMEGLPVLSVEGMLLLVAARPAGVEDWDSAAVWIRAGMERAGGKLVEMAAVSPAATCARLGYLAAVADRHDLADVIGRDCPPPSGPVHLGPRHRGGRYDQRFQVVDGVFAG